MRCAPLPIAFLVAAGSLSAAEPSYFHEVRPVLQRQCQGCHQPNLKSSNLDLSSYEGLIAGGKRGPGLEFVVKYLTGEMKPQMPLGQPPLSAAELDLVRNWVTAGGKDDTPAEARETVSAGKPAVYTQPPVMTALAFSPDGKTLAVSGNREVLIHTLDGSWNELWTGTKQTRLLSFKGRRLIYTTPETADPMDGKLCTYRVEFERA